MEYQALAKKTTTKKKTTKRAANGVASGSYRFPRADKPRSKGEVYSQLADQTGLSKKEVAAVFDAMSSMMASDLKKGGPQVFNVPGLMKVSVQRKPATKARKGTNPFTGEEMMFKAKPASKTVKASALKGLKDMV